MNTNILCTCPNFKSPLNAVILTSRMMLPPLLHQKQKLFFSFYFLKLQTHEVTCGRKALAGILWFPISRSLKRGGYPGGSNKTTAVKKGKRGGKVEV